MTDDANDQASHLGFDDAERPSTGPVATAVAARSGGPQRGPSGSTRVALSMMALGASVAALLVWQAFHNEPRPLAPVDGRSPNTSVVSATTSTLG
jgi:hypothetical protein